jgi:hypothetical protein
MKILCSLCGRTEEREYKLTRSVDEPLELQKCSCSRGGVELKMVDLKLILRSSKNLVLRKKSGPPKMPLCIDFRDIGEGSTQTMVSPISRPKALRIADGVIHLLPYVVSRKEYELRIHGNLAAGCRSDKIGDKTRVIKEEGTSCSIALADKTSRTFKCRRRDPKAFCVLKSQESTVSVFPGIEMCKSEEIRISEDDFKAILSEDTISSYRVSFVERYCNVGNWILKLRKYIPGSRNALEIEFKGEFEPSTAEIASVLQEFLMLYCGPLPLKNFLDPVFRRAIVTNKRPVYDQRVYLEEQNEFYVKADGESCLVVDGGYMWILCRYNESFEVTGYKNKAKYSSFSTRPDIVLSELLFNTDLVFISVLSSNGNIVPAVYSLKPEMFDLKKFSDLGLVFRDYHSTYDKAKGSLDSVSYPCDGVVAINTQSGVTIRIKEATADLISHGGWLCSGTDESNYKRRFPAPPEAVEGNVFECSLEVISLANVKLTSLFYRPDKVRPNSSRVYESVVHSASKEGDNSGYFRREITNYCFSVREKMYEKAMNKRQTGCLVIDIGTGRFQCSSFFRDQETSFLFCDPNLTNLRALERPVNVDLTSLSAESKLEALRRLNKGKYKIGIYRGRVEDLFLSSKVKEWVVDNSVPVTLSFSASKCYECLLDMLKNDFTVLFCCYVYDAVIAKSKNINFMGVSMSYDQSKVASERGRFKFGPDGAIVEYAVRYSDFYQYVDDDSNQIVVGSQLVILDTVKLYSHIKLFSSK